MPLRRPFRARRAAVPGLGLAGVLALAACTSTGGVAIPSTITIPASVTVGAGLHTNTPTFSAMPDFVGKRLSQAEDTLGLGVSAQATDLLKGRHVIVPADWVVCTQDPAPGSPVGSTVRFGVVKRGETCP